jgi:XRE family transcriptional regulator, thiamine biosynthesis regulator
MLIPHIIVVEEVLPEVRRRLARSLHKEKWSQDKISSLLGTSQAMVSRYLKEEKEIPESLETLVSLLSEDLGSAAVAGMDMNDLVDRFCNILDVSLSDGLLLERYRERFKREPGRAIYGSGARGMSGSSILQELELAVNYLMTVPIPDLIPAVKVNIAFAMDNAASIDDVAAYPGRLPDRNGSIIRPLLPDFATSNHLAGMLIGMMRMVPRARAVMNLRFDERIEGTIVGSGDRIVRLKGRSIPEEDIGIGEMEIDLNIVDPGDFGIEPCLYIFGRSPLSIVNRAIKLQKMLDNKGEEDA